MGRVLGTFFTILPPNDELVPSIISPKPSTFRFHGFQVCITAMLFDNYDIVPPGECCAISREGYSDMGFNPIARLY